MVVTSVDDCLVLSPKCPTIFNVIFVVDFLGRTEVRVKDILAETQKLKGPITKRLLLHEVETGEVVVKLNLQLFDAH